MSFTQDELYEVKRKVDVLWAASRTARPSVYPYQALAKTDAVTAISALSGTTPGSGTVTVQRVNSSGDLEAATLGDGSNMDLTVYNWTTTASEKGVYVWIGQDLFGTWWYLNAACP